MDIPEDLKDRINFVIDYVSENTNDWLTVKKELINSFPWKERTRFSKRHPSTKKQIPNEFDESVILYWKEKTGIQLEIDPNKLHDPNWIHRKKGWALVAINEERSNNAKRRKQKQHTS